jgi:hypothetical protein
LWAWIACYIIGASFFITIFIDSEKRDRLESEISYYYKQIALINKMSESDFEDEETNRHILACFARLEQAKFELENL